MLEHQQITGFEGKCRRFRNSSERLKTHCVKNQFGRKKVPKEA